MSVDANARGTASTSPVGDPMEEEDDLVPDAASAAPAGSAGSAGSAPVAQFAPPLRSCPHRPGRGRSGTAQSRKSPHLQTFAQRRPILFRHFVPLAASANLSAYETSLIYKGLKLASSLERDPRGWSWRW